MTDNSTQTEHNTPTFWHAPDIAKAGYKVFPVEGKAPSVAGGFYAATTDLSQLAEWIEDGRGDHDIAIPTGIVSDVVVIDADSLETFAEIEERYGPPTVKTKRGGHWWFRHPRKGKVSSTQIREHLDRKADGGYVVVPPSRGRTWTDGIPEKDALPTLPDELREEKRDSEPTGGSAPTMGAPIPEGKRNITLTSDAGAMRRRGMDEEAIFAALKITNEQRCTPALDVAEVRNIARSVASYPPAENVAFLRVGNRQAAGDGTKAFNRTDVGNAKRLIHRHGHNLRYCWLWSKWLVWDGRRWIRDDSGEVFRLAKDTVANIYREAAVAPDDETRKALAGHAMRSEAGARIKEMVDLARSDVPIMPDELDADPWLLNTRSGTVDLRTGKLREHRREDLITKIAPVEYRPDADAPVWAAFLDRVQPNEEMRAFLQRSTGYSATGDTSEQCLFINHGVGANGKSTFQEALAAALGDYAMRAPTEMLMAKRAGGVPNDVARLKGSRFVAASETEEGRRLAESLIKDLTGQDTITARFMRAEWFDFAPTHKLWLSTNHKPEIRGTDVAIWRRIRLIPWTVTIPPTEQDKKLPAKLRDELPGILAWIVRGCLQWQRKGLQAPDEVRKATVEYRAEMDVLAGFLSDCCELEGDLWDYSKDLYDSYKRWCEDNGERTESKRRFGERLRERGFARDKGGSRGAHLWRGLRLTEGEKARLAGKLTLEKTAVSSSSDLSDPKKDMTDRNSKGRGVMSEKGSEGSEGSEV
jgi:putative DNA primase/helicase